jgi:hypothetical protein
LPEIPSFPYHEQSEFWVLLDGNIVAAMVQFVAILAELVALVVVIVYT